MEIGQKVQVYRLRDRVGKEIADKLGKVGTIKDFRVTDGSSIGAFLSFDDNTTAWFFGDELRPTA